MRAFTNEFVPMEEQKFLILAGLLLAAMQGGFHYFLQWRLRIDPAVEGTLTIVCHPEFGRFRQKLATAVKVQSHIGMVFGPWLSLFLAAVSADSPDHPAYAPVLVGSVTATISYLLFIELPLQATRQWLRNRTVSGGWLSAANILLSIWCTPFWVVFPFQIYFLVRLLNVPPLQDPSEVNEHADPLA